MSIRLEPCLWCDRCSHWERMSPYLKAPQIRKRAQKAGWSRGKNDDGKVEDLCPHCTQKHQEQKRLPAVVEDALSGIKSDLSMTMFKHHPNAEPEEVADALGLDLCFDGSLRVRR